MNRTYPALLAALSLAFATGCASDDAVEKDLKDATEEVRDAGEKAKEKVGNAADDVEKAVDGDSDGDGK